jgi:hypothetical protein
MYFISLRGILKLIFQQGDSGVNNCSVGRPSNATIITKLYLSLALNETEA